MSFSNSRTTFKVFQPNCPCRRGTSDGGVDLLFTKRHEREQRLHQNCLHRTKTNTKCVGVQWECLQVRSEVTKTILCYIFKRTFLCVCISCREGGNQLKSSLRRSTHPKSRRVPFSLISDRHPEFKGRDSLFVIVIYHWEFCKKRTRTICFQLRLRHYCLYGTDNHLAKEGRWMVGRGLSVLQTSQNPFHHV